MSIWAIDADNVWMPTTNYNFHLGPRGLGWTRPAGELPLLGPIPVFGVATDDVWARSADGLAHWNGQEWSPSFPLSAVTTKLHGVSSDDLWAISESQLFHWDGAAWTEVAVSPDPEDTFTDLWAFGRRQVAIAGRGSRGVQAWIWDGSLDPLPAPPPGGITSPSVFASGPDDIWFAGSHGAAHYDGDIWSSANTEQLTDLWGNGPDDVWMLDFAGNAIHWDGNTLQKEPLPDGFSPTTATGAGTELWVTDYWTPTIAHRRVDGEWELLLERPYGSVGDAVVDGDGILWAATVTLGLAHQAEDDFVWDFDVGDRLGLANGVVVTFDDDRSFRRTTSGGWEELGDAAILYEACTASDGSVWAVGDRLARLEGDRWVPDGPAVDGRMYQVECGGDTVFAFDSADMLQRH